jgi:hypothetical protein
MTMLYSYIVPYATQRGTYAFFWAELDDTNKKAIAAY